MSPSTRSHGRIHSEALQSSRETPCVLFVRSLRFLYQGKEVVVYGEQYSLEEFSWDGVGQEAQAQRSLRKSGGDRMYSGI